MILQTEKATVGPRTSTHSNSLGFIRVWLRKRFCGRASAHASARSLDVYIWSPKNWKPSMAHIAQERGHGAAESLTCSRHSGQQASRIPDCLQACTILHHLDRVLLGSLVSKTKGKTRKPKVSKATRSIMTESNKSGRNRWKETNQIEHYDSTSCTFRF